nr:hypothetical protein Iba_chr05eCG10360 [Ipomoea batatas]
MEHYYRGLEGRVRPTSSRDRRITFNGNLPTSNAPHSLHSSHGNSGLIISYPSCPSRKNPNISNSPDYLSPPNWLGLNHNCYPGHHPGPLDSGQRLNRSDLNAKIRCRRSTDRWSPVSSSAELHLPPSLSLS